MTKAMYKGQPLYANAEFIAGDGVTIDGDVINLDCPVRDLTQEEYESLSPEEKTKGLIFLPDDGSVSGGSGGVTFIPSVSEEGELSWTNNGDLENPEPVNIKGPPGENATINGQNTLEIVAGDNVEVEQSDETLTISVPEVYSTEERVIGTYMGKPLYQRTWFAHTATQGNVWTATGIAIDDLDTLVDYRAIADTNIVHAKTSLPYSESASAYAILNYWTGYNGRIGFYTLCYHNSGEYFYNMPFTLTAKYTKTTDQATVQLTSQSIQTAAISAPNLTATAVISGMEVTT